MYMTFPKMKRGSFFQLVSAGKKFFILANMMKFHTHKHLKWRKKMRVKKLTLYYQGSQLKSKDDHRPYERWWHYYCYLYSLRFRQTNGKTFRRTDYSIWQWRELTYHEIYIYNIFNFWLKISSPAHPCPPLSND